MKLKLALVTLLFFLAQPVFAAKTAEESKREPVTAETQKREVAQENKQEETKQQEVNEGEKKEGLKSDETKKDKEDEYKMDVNVPLTIVDFVLTNKKGAVLGIDLKEDDINNMLEVTEDGVPQNIALFEPRDSRKSIVLLLDYSTQATIWSYYGGVGDVWIGPFYLINSLQDKDYISIITYDIRPRLKLDFTRNRDDAENAIRTLGYPMFSESNISDAVWKVLDAIKDRKERMAVVLISTGLDTFPRSGRSFEDEVLKRVANERVNFYTIGIGEKFKIRIDSRLPGPARMDLIQAENRLKFLAEYSGGFASFVRFEAQYPEIFRDVAARLETQYTIGYYPTNRDFNGKSRTIKVSAKKEFLERARQTMDLNGDGKVNEKDAKEKIIIVHKTKYFPGKTFKPNKPDKKSKDE